LDSDASSGGSSGSEDCSDSCSDDGDESSSESEGESDNRAISRHRELTGVSGVKRQRSVLDRREAFVGGSGYVPQNATKQAKREQLLKKLGYLIAQLTEETSKLQELENYVKLKLVVPVEVAP